MKPEGAYRFGGLEFSPTSGELRNVESGFIVTRLQPQVAALLSALLERPGAVITRAELHARLWPDTTVDFDEGLNFCVRQLRLALGDEAGAPRFVETLARRGYRFKAPVTRGEETPAIPMPNSGARRRTPIVVFAGLVVAGAVLAAFVLTRSTDRPVRTDVVLAVVPFRADTTDSTMMAYWRRLNERVNAGVSAGSGWNLVADTNTATHVLSGALKRRGFSVEVFVQLVRRPDHRHVWADSILDSYAFQGNSTLTADRIARSVMRLLDADTVSAAPPP